jgi:hypothetical protein
VESFFAERLVINVTECTHKRHIGMKRERLANLLPLGKSLKLHSLSSSLLVMNSENVLHMATNTRSHTKSFHVTFCGALCKIFEVIPEMYIEEEEE